MLIFQIFWRMYLSFLIFSICIFPLTFFLPKTAEFIMWKITFYYGLFGILLLLFGFMSKRGFIGLIKPEGIEFPVFIWSKIDIYYSVVFILLAIINAWFVLFMSVDQWVNFKLFAPLPILVLYTVLVSLLVSKGSRRH